MPRQQQPQQKQQQFTFIDVLATKDVNKRRIKKHVSSDTNRRKRYAAVSLYQRSLIDAVNEPTSLNTSGKACSDNVNENESPIATSSPSTTPRSQITVHKGSSDCDDQGRRSPSSQKLPARLHAWNIYLSLLRNGVSSPWQMIRKQSSSPRQLMDKIPVLNTTSSLPMDIGAMLPCPTTFQIDPPTFMKETQYGLVAVKSFMEDKYHSTWKHDLAANPYVYEHDYELGVFRECLYLAFDELKQGRASTGFAILNTALEAATDLIKKNEPVLTFTLLDIVMDIRNLQDARLNKMLKDHLASLVATLLGAGHPLVMLLKRPILREERSYMLSSLFQLMVDTNTGLFGENDFQTVGMRFGILQHNIAEGSRESLKQASSHFEVVSREWIDRSPSDSIFRDVIAIEGAKFYDRQGLPPPETVSTVVERALDNYEKLAVLTGYTDHTTSDGSNRDIGLTERLKPLGRQWLSASYHAMVIYAYTHLRDISKNFSNCSSDQRQAVSWDHFAAKTVRLLLNGGDVRI